MCSVKRHTLTLSNRGKQEIERVKLQKRWTLDQWLREVSQQLEPTKDWEVLWQEDPEIFSLSRTTLKKFLRKESILADNFIALCSVMGVNWQQVVDLDCPAIIGNLPEASPFYGRQMALDTLQNWIEKQTRLIIVHGRAGIGKSVLVRQLLNHVADQFDALIWHSLESALHLSEWLETLIPYLDPTAQQFSLKDLTRYLTQHRCLIVLDQWESIQKEGSFSQYQTNYEDYQELLKQIVSDRHQSSVILLSREKPQNMLLKRAGDVVQFFQLEGLQYPEDKAFLEAEKLTGTEVELQNFTQRYNNPLFLKVAAERVRTTQNGRVSIFIDPAVSAVVHVDDISEVMGSEFRCLSRIEQDILYWLAIWRNSVSYEQLQKCVTTAISHSELILALDSLISSHAIIQVQTDPESEYWLEPITLKYVTHRFVNKTAKTISEAIQKEDLQLARLMHSHAFMIGGDAVLNQEQLRRIVESICHLLLERFSKMELKQSFEKLQSMYHQGEEISSSKNYLHQNLEVLCSVIEAMAF
jgi:hypothetical protein